MHALKLALDARADLRIMHVESNESGGDWHEFPRVRETLERWGVLPPGSSKEDVVNIGLRIRKILSYREDAAASILEHLSEIPADLIVLATHQRDGLERLLSKTVAEPVARRSGIMTLFVPAGTGGFIDPADGSVRLQRVLIPADHVPHPQSAVDAAAAMAFVLGEPRASFTVLHVGSNGNMPEVQFPRQAEWEWRQDRCEGDVVAEILRVSVESSVDLIVMSTQGHQDFLDALRGSTTERVVRGARCPVLAIPAR
jgi:nucleotide-binding universal stress UspA family protein